VTTVDNLRRHAKRWLKSIREADPSARERLLRAYPGAPQPPTLRDVQHALARERGHENWRALMRAVEDATTQDALGLTPLDHAALNGQDEVAHRLLAGGAPMTLPAAIVLGRPEEIERLVRDRPESVSMTSERWWARVLARATARAPGHVVLTLIETLMRYRAGLSIVNVEVDDETIIDGAGYTPLHAAAVHGNTPAAMALLKSGANPRARDRKTCRTPARWAAGAGHNGLASFILDVDVDIFDAIEFDRADRVGDILDRDPAAIDRPFKEYAAYPAADASAPGPDMTPFEWAKQKGTSNALRVLTERGGASRTAEDIRRAERVATFLRAACWDHHVHGKSDHRMHDRAAQRILAEHPSIARDSIHPAIVCGDRDEVARLLAATPEAARVRGGAREWTPILYLAYTRFTHPQTIENAVAIGRMLLDGGADPNDYYMAGDAKYTVLTGVAGEGEQDSPRQPYAAELFDLLLERGAEPFDSQVLYNTHFSGDLLWWLELVYKHTIHGPRGVAWKDPEWRMFDMGAYGSGARFLLETALKKDKPPLAEWALAHGANPNAAPARDRRFPQRSLYEFAVLEQRTEMVDLLARHGAVTSVPALNENEQFISACFRIDHEQARRQLIDHPEYLRLPHAMFEAARRNRPDALALLLDLGFSIDLQDQTGKRALHEAGVNNALRAVQFLIEHGAEVDPRESNYDNTPIGWAAHGDHVAVMDFLSRYSRDIWTLCFHGYVARVREILAEDPTLARVVDREGYTPLWWLPDDEGKAMEIVDLLLAAGANPSATNKDGETAAGWARRRAMHDVAARLD
jgi:uncharacterized protein